MQLTEIRLAKFRSFGATPVTISLGDQLTALIGANASGKTTLLDALALLFGVTQRQRTAQKSDFHTPTGTPPGDATSRDFFIEVTFSFPELATGDATADTIAPIFRHMLLAEPGQTPIVKMRFEARWDDDHTMDGTVQQQLFWIESLDAETTAHTSVVSATDRALIQFYYAPATRDAEAQINATAGTLASRLLRAVSWADATKEVAPVFRAADSPFLSDSSAS